MNLIKSFTIGNVTYNALMASAVEQDKLVSLLSAALIERAVTMSQQGMEIGENVLVPMFMAMDHTRKTDVAAILMNKVVIHGSNTDVTARDFQSRMVEYNTLLARLLVWNLSDFFTWLASVVLDGANKEENPAP